MNAVITRKHINWAAKSSVLALRKAAKNAIMLILSQTGFLGSRNIDKASTSCLFTCLSESFEILSLFISVCLHRFIWPVLSLLSVFLKLPCWTNSVKHEISPHKYSLVLYQLKKANLISEGLSFSCDFSLPSLSYFHFLICPTSNTVIHYFTECFHC